MKRLLDIRFCWYCIGMFCEELGGCDNSNSALSGSGNSFAIFCGLLLARPFLFWVAFVFFFPQFLSRLTFAEFISACSIVYFGSSFEISVLNTFNLLAIATVWQHTLIDLYQTPDLLRHVTTCPFTRVSYSTGTGILMFSCYGNSIYWSHLDQQLFCLLCWVVLTPLCVFPQLWFQEQN